jgi:DNA helicase HerA-like ATPase
LHFSVSQLRTAATCPRIHYFDVEEARRRGEAHAKSTLVWLQGGRTQVGGGALFHTVVERFNRRARHAPEVRDAVERSYGSEQLKQALLAYVNTQCVDLDKLAKRSVPLRQAFTRTLIAYFSELSEIINYATSNGVSPDEVLSQLFGDNRRRVDVTFHVGDEHQAHVAGAIDYVFYDWRTKCHRIVDYKLTPHDHVDRDLFQVCAYSLMHHHQHRTEPAVAVFYLHPKRRTYDKSWNQVRAERYKVYDLLASMVAWGSYDERAGRGLKPPGNPIWCAGCKWNRDGQCEARLGPKAQGDRDHRWEELSSLKDGAEPRADVHTIATPDAEEPEPDLDEVDGPESQPSSRGIPSAPAPALPTEGLFLGYDQATGAARTIPTAAINTHIAVVGAAGSGKTWTAKAIVEEVVLAGIPVVAVDPQGDLVQFLRARNADAFQGEDAERQRRYLDRVEPRIFTPGTSHGTRLSLDPLRLPSDEELGRIDKPERRREERDAMIQAVAANLVSLAAVGGEEESQRTFLFLVLDAMRSRGSVELNDVVEAIGRAGDLGLPSDPDHILKKTEREKLARKLNTFVLGPGRNLFSGGARLDLDEFTRPSRAGKVPLNVIYLNALSDDSQKHFFLASLASEIYRWMVTSLDATGGNPNLLFYIDEARDWIPAGSSKPPAKEPLIRLFTQGRKYGVGCLLCTQSPRSVDYNVFGNCSTKIVGRMEAKQDVDRIADWFTVSGPAPEWVAGRKGAEKGTFVGRWPGLGPAEEGRPWKGRLLYSCHEGAWSPDRVEREVEAIR